MKKLAFYILALAVLIPQGLFGGLGKPLMIEGGSEEVGDTQIVVVDSSLAIRSTSVNVVDKSFSGCGVGELSGGWLQKTAGFEFLQNCQTVSFVGSIADVPHLAFAPAKVYPKVVVKGGAREIDNPFRLVESLGHVSALPASVGFDFSVLFTSYKLAEEVRHVGSVKTFKLYDVEQALNQIWRC